MQLEHCLIFLDEEAEVPAQEAGMIADLPLKEGQNINKSEQVAQIDDSIPKMALNVAKFKYAAEKVKADNNIPEQFATASAKVAKAAYDVDVHANDRTPNTVPQVILNEKLLEYEKMMMSIENAQDGPNHRPAADGRRPGRNGRLANEPRTPPTAFAVGRTGPQDLPPRGRMGAAGRTGGARGAA